MVVVVGKEGGKGNGGQEDTVELRDTGEVSGGGSLSISDGVPRLDMDEGESCLESRLET